MGEAVFDDFYTHACGHTALVPCFAGNASVHPLQQWRDRTAQALRQNHRLLALYGRKIPATHEVWVYAVLLGAKQLKVLRGRGQVGERYPCLTLEFAQAHIFERELWEQTGLLPAEHPWLKPVRFEGAGQGHCSDYPFFKMRGGEVHEVGVGPIHAGVIEPGHFRFMCHGETVHHLEIQLGYQHRDVETQVLRRPAHLQSALVESIVGDSVIAYATAFHATLEHLSLRHTTPAVQASRAIALELERIAVHLSTLTGLMTDIGFQQPAGTYQRLRTALINATQKICGNRFGKGWIRPGCATPMDTEQRTHLAQTLERFLRDFVQVNQLVCASRSVRARFQGVGTVSTQTAQEIGLCGVVARASGVAIDLRHALGNGTYILHQPITEATGDCWARMRQRMREAQASTEWLLERLNDMAFDLQSAPPRSANAVFSEWPLLPDTLGVSTIEGVRGPVTVALQTNAHGQVVHAKFQDPSLANWFGLAQALRGQQISDFPICNKSFDLSYCGNDL